MGVGARGAAMDSHPPSPGGVHLHFPWPFVGAFSESLAVAPLGGSLLRRGFRAFSARRTCHFLATQLPESGEWGGWQDSCGDVKRCLACPACTLCQVLAVAPHICLLSAHSARGPHFMQRSKRPRAGRSAFRSHSRVQWMNPRATSWAALGPGPTKASAQALSRVACRPLRSWRNWRGCLLIPHGPH